MNIDSASGGNFENLVVDGSSVITTIADDADATNLTLSATGSVAEGGTITYTATLDSPADTVVTVNLSNGQSIKPSTTKFSKFPPLAESILTETESPPA